MSQKISLFIFAALLAVLSACASTKSYDAMLGTWVGKTEEELVASWGVPDHQRETEAGTKTFLYRSDKSVTYPAGPVPCVGVHNTTIFSDCGGSFSSPIPSAYYCETIFTLAKGRVTRWEHKGNDCRM